ncbi:YesL family protein [Paenibacillus puldeungensis]|uniref:YesL family protein n=1 Tax=Paenibacillus puldeungensis TaxID=696536 RepID=A0ABW3RX54_9BACL
MEYKGFMGGFYKITEWIMRISGSNLLWLICSLPFFFFLFSAVLSPDLTLQDTAWFMAPLAPFTIFPATAALFSVARKWVMGEADLSIIKVFFKGYKENYKQSMLGGIFYTLLFVIMAVDYEVYMKQFSNLQFIGMIVLILLILFSISLFNFFSLVAHYQMKVIPLIKNALLFTIIKPFRALSTVLCTVGLGFLTLKFTWLILFGFGSLTAFVAFYNFYVAYNKVQEKVEKMRQAEEDTSDNDRDSVTDEEGQLELPDGGHKEKD